MNPILPPGVTWDWAGTTIVTVTVFIVGAIVSAVVAFVGWALKKLGERLIDELVETQVQIKTLKTSVDTVLQTSADVDKLKNDMHLYYKKFRELEKEVRDKGTDAT
jgi:uncharacterized coiled-coil protein SlyX